MTEAGEQLHAKISDARERFLAGELRSQPSENDGPGLRSTILASWRRSEAHDVDVLRPSPSYRKVRADQGVLMRAARPTLDALEAELVNEPVCIILTDASGVVLARRGGDHALHDRLDAAMLAPGFRYTEGEVGTNGIGTAIEAGRPTLVYGAEHYAENLGVFACGGAPIKHPVTGALMGVLDLTSLEAKANSLLLAFAKIAARRIEKDILDATNALDRAVLNDYVATCRHTGGPVIALGPGLVMMNDQTQQRFDDNDQVALLARIRETTGQSTPGSVLTDLPSGVSARLSYRPTFADDRLAGGVVRIQAQTPATAGVTGQRAQVPVQRGRSASASITWSHTLGSIAEAVRRDEYLVLEGERGVGKAVAVATAFREARPGRTLTVLDAADATEETLLDMVDEALEAGRSVLLRHADHLGRDAVTELSDILHRSVNTHHEGDPPWMAVTIDPDHGLDRLGAEVVPFFPRTIVVPPLRHHLEDVPLLCRTLLGQLGRADVTFDAAAESQLMRLPWPGNVAQLRKVIEAVTRRRRSGEITPADLPPECRTAARRKLTQMEVLERDAIVEALDAHGGDKTAAARALGMSRATIYRRIRNFGILS